MASVVLCHPTLVGIPAGVHDPTGNGSVGRDGIGAEAWVRKPAGETDLRGDGVGRDLWVVMVFGREGSRLGSFSNAVLGSLAIEGS